MKDEVQRYYAAIDLKSYFASVECVERGLDPLTTNLVVADSTRTNKTICLAVTPSLKSFGISGRARLFEVYNKVNEINKQKHFRYPDCTDKSYDINVLNQNPATQIDFIIAPPRMAYYIKYSSEIYKIYLRYVAPEDIHPYSIDEVFIDLTSYTETYGLTPSELAIKMVHDIYEETGITATVGVGTNLYLAKIAMDIVAKHMQPNEKGVRLAKLNEMRYRKLLWNHQPLTDFWRVGRGTANALKKVGIYTMGDIARCSIGKASDYYNEDLLYKLFGINAELLIDHAWGYEPCTMEEVKAYKPETNSLSSGQVLQEPYSYDKARLVIAEMTDAMCLKLVKKQYLTNNISLTICFDTTNLEDAEIKKQYNGPVEYDYYGRKVPKKAHKSMKLSHYTSSGKFIRECMLEMFDEVTNPILLVRKIYIAVNNLKHEDEENDTNKITQLDLFSDINKELEDEKRQQEEEQKEHDMQKAVLEIQEKFGKNAILKGMSLMDGATAKKRNSQIGGHKA